MAKKHSFGWTIVALLCGAAVLLAGCETNDGRQAKVARKAVTSLEDTRQELVRADHEVNQALTAMDQLASEPRDLRQSYKSFTTEIEDATEQSEEARERADKMSRYWHEYIASWERETEGITSPELRASAAERRQTVRENYDSLRDMARDLQTAYEPFVNQLRDIQRALSLDLTPAGVEATKPAMETARQAGTQLQEQIDAFITELDRVSARRTTPPGQEPVAGSQ